MLSIYCDTANSKAVGISEKILSLLTTKGVKTQIFQYLPGLDYPGVSIFVFIDSCFETHIQYKYYILSIGIDEPILQNTIGRINHPPSVKICLNIHSHEEMLISEFCSKILFPKIPKYQVPSYHSYEANSSVVTKDFTITKVETFIEEEDYKIINVELENVLEYSAASNISLLGENSDEIVDFLMTTQGYARDIGFTIDNHEYFSKLTSGWSVLKTHCDLASLVRKPVLKLLGFYCLYEKDREHIELLTSIKGKEEFRVSIEQQLLSIPEILQKFNIKIPLGDLVQILDKIRPRVYSLSSSFTSSETMKFSIQVTSKGNFTGFFSKFISILHTPCSISGSLSTGVFSLIPSRPLLLIANGTGISPFRSLLSEIHNTQLSIPSVALVIGLRTLNHFPYKHDFERFLKQPDCEPVKYEHVLADYSSSLNTLDRLFVGLSRQGDRTYIQDILWLHSDIFWDYVQTGSIFICGGLEMSKSVCGVLKKLTVERVGEGGWKDVQDRIKIEAWG